MKYLLFLLPIVVWSCKSINIPEPIVEIIDPPLPVLSVSKITVPIEIDLQSQLNEVEKSLPISFDGKQEQCEGISFAYKFIREPINFQLTKTGLYYEVDGKFQLKLSYCPKCHSLWDEKGTCAIPRIYASCGVGEPMRSVKVGYNTSVSITDSYMFNTETKLQLFDVLDPCEITVFKYDATSQLEKQVKSQLKSLEKDIDRQIESVDIRSSIKDVWRQLEEPMDLNGYGLLYLKPKSMALSPVTFDAVKKRAQLTAELTAEPFITTNKEQAIYSDLPKQAKYTKGQGYALNILVKASYDSINKIMNKDLMGYKIPFNGKEIVVDSLHILGNQEQKLIIQVHFSGSKKGVFFLVGTPIITDDQFFVLTNLAYDINSKSILLKTARWLFDKRILDELNKSAKYDLNPLLNETKTTITNQINSQLAEGVYLSGTVDRLAVSTIQLGAAGFFLTTEVSGNMKLKMK
jgi:hypothetical protein